MNNLFQTPARASIGDRLERLTPDTQAKWGTMTAPIMLCHVGDQMRVALGELSVKPVKSPFSNRLSRNLFVFLLPWPKGKIRAPKMQPTEPGDWEADREAVNLLIKRYKGGESRTDWAPHPAFGELTAKEWGKLTYKHLDHHLRQFGL